MLIVLNMGAKKYFPSQYQEALAIFARKFREKASMSSFGRKMLLTKTGRWLLALEIQHFGPPGQPRRAAVDEEQPPALEDKGPKPLAKASNGKLDKARGSSAAEVSDVGRP